MISVLLLTASIGYYAYNESLYMKLYEQNGVTERTGMDEKNLRAVTRRLIDYMAGEAETLDMTAVIRGEERTVFNDREKAHMVDVKALFWLSDAIKWTFFAVALLLGAAAMKLRKVGMIIDAGIFQAIVSLVLAGGLIAISLTNFSDAFIRFHELFFTNDLWLLDPRTDTLIQMLPEPFFRSMALRMSGTWLAASLGIGAVCTFVKMRAK